MPSFTLHANGNTYTIIGDRAVCAVAASLTESTIAGFDVATVAECNALIKHRRYDLIAALETISGDDAFTRAAVKLAAMLIRTDTTGMHATRATRRNGARA